VVDVRAGGRRIRGLDASERQARRRLDLLEAALELIATKGYANTSIEQICQTAFVGTKSFYEIFDSKEACYLDLLRETSRQISERVAAAFDPPPEDELAAARSIIATFAHAIIDDPRIARTTFGTAGGISPAVEEQRRANRRWAAEFVVGLWHHYGMADRPGVELYRMAVGLIGGLFDLVIDWLHDVGDAPSPEAIQSMVDELTTFYGLVRRGLTAT
jgi:AcrR family transcriptional regulator